MNLNLYGHDGQWLMVDCGVTFPRPGRVIADGTVHGRGEPPVQMADPAFIADRREQLAGLIITHAHEDHIGAVPYLWPLLQCPVYTSRFTAEILRRKLAEFDLLHRVPIHVVDVDERRTIGPFEVQWLALTHSIPDPNALMIRAPAGRIFHSGDWKLDEEPLVGHGYTPGTFKALAEEGVTAMVCDSTNATVAGHSMSESALEKGLLAATEDAPGRVIVACFGSNIARLHTWPTWPGPLAVTWACWGVRWSTCVGLPRRPGSGTRTITLFLPPTWATCHGGGAGGGHRQSGEPRTALRRMAMGSHPDVELEPGDRVIFSARAIPGNEDAIEALITSLKERGVEVITAEDADLPIHASGHPARDELRAMYQWVQPTIAIPVHGEAEHMEAHAGLARECGVPRALLGRNGDLFMIRPVPGMRRQVVETGRLGWEKGALVRVV